MNSSSSNRWSPAPNNWRCSLLIVSLGICGPLSACRDSASSVTSINDISMSVLYDSDGDSFSSVGYYSTEGRDPSLIEIGKDDRDGSVRLRLVSHKGGNVGVNKRVMALYGFVDFEYRVLAQVKRDNLFLYAIPMTGDPAAGLTEAGTAGSSGRLNGFSPLRRRFPLNAEVPGSADPQWRTGRLEFDFRTLAGVDYVIIAPRLNEGSVDSGPAELLIRRMRVFGAEPKK